MGDVNDDRSPESETWLDRRLDKADEEIWKWMLVGVIGFAGVLLGDELPPKALGVSTAALFALWLISFLRLRRLKKRLAAPIHKIAPPADASPEHSSSPSTLEPMTDLHYTVLCAIVDAHDEGQVVKKQDILELLHLKKSALEPALLWLDGEKYIWEEEDQSLEDDPGALHPLPKGLSYVTSRRERH